MSATGRCCASSRLTDRYLLVSGADAHERERRAHNRLRHTHEGVMPGPRYRELHRIRRTTVDASEFFGATACANVNGPGTLERGTVFAHRIAIKPQHEIEA